jgi:hypothetical protein
VLLSFLRLSLLMLLYHSLSFMLLLPLLVDLRRTLL